ncbi:hypothetical protein AWH56_002235 [Anaerobacillus isosaccharinicus]|uniref:YtkA-like domain-containing protein n=1 Tax=Anaerobacillus isosaccharinicus TaxID=1532552 RepID=A0A1S2ME80_9BACI|nr:hypothetical protein [Anaerobacillus isosaccharinicus]MBA5585137.1 hypothetical protein [Anaerobacillus isosaccharinicus]QOY36520.1 hypothetical protein AWH56_002235 [Anaerobacillus isosaccharinicus]
MKITVEKSKKNMLLYALAIASFLIFSLYAYVSVTNTADLFDLNVEIFPVSTPVKMGDRTSLQVLVYDKDNLAREDVKVEIELFPENKIGEPIKEHFVHIENGLYETNVQFFQWGNWDATVTVKNRNSQFVKNSKIFVQR